MYELGCIILAAIVFIGICIATGNEVQAKGVKREADKEKAKAKRMANLRY